MRKVVASFFISLDGVVEAPQDWHFPYFNDEMGAAVAGGIASADGFLLGRRTYEEWAGFWPHQDGDGNPMAAAINRLPKYVASRTLSEAGWQNSTVLEGDLADAVARLDGTLLVAGSATLVRSLLDAGLVDELRLLLHPVVVGRGAKLFQNGTQAPLELVESQAFTTGVLNLTYRRAAA